MITIKARNIHHVKFRLQVFEMLNDELNSLDTLTQLEESKIIEEVKNSQVCQ